MITKVLSGGQTGADQAGWLAAKAFGLETGGWMPKGFLTEAGPCPHFADLYGARELETTSYPARTQANVADANMTIWFGSTYSAGFLCTRKAAKVISYIAYGPLSGPPPELAEVIRRRGDNPIILNVAGNRESKAPGIGYWVFDYLCEVFRILKEPD
jgi:hypothetical protein